MLGHADGVRTPGELAHALGRSAFLTLLEVRRLAVEFGLPIRLSGPSTERTIGFPFRQLAAEEGVLFPDHFVHVRGVGTRKVLERVLFDLRPGVTEIYAHPAVDTPELRAFAPDWPARVDDHDLLTRDHAIRSLAERAGVILIGYRELRELQRAESSTAARA